MKGLTQAQTIAVASGMVMARRNCTAKTAAQVLVTESAARGLDIPSFADLIVAAHGQLEPEDMA
jgi:AmiR/NasT family two-component response regulator